MLAGHCIITANEPCICRGETFNQGLKMIIIIFRRFLEYYEKLPVCTLNMTGNMTGTA